MIRAWQWLVIGGLLASMSLVVACDESGDSGGPDHRPASFSRASATPVLELARATTHRDDEERALEAWADLVARRSKGRVRAALLRGDLGHASAVLDALERAYEEECLHGRAKAEDLEAIRALMADYECRRLDFVEVLGRLEIMLRHLAVVEEEAP